MSIYKEVSLELMTFNDFEDFSDITLHDAGINRYLTYYAAETKSELYEIFELILDYPDAHLMYKVLNSANQMVGWIQCDIRPTDELDLNYFIGEKFRSKGYLKNALTKLCTIAKSNGFFALEAMIEPENANSLRVVRSLNWKERSLQSFHLKSSVFRCAL